MASRGRRGAGDRVLEGKHVIGLFMLMLLFSGVFFSLGYVMGRNQYDGQVRAATTNSRPADPEYVPKSDPLHKKTVQADIAESAAEPGAPPADPIWNFPSAGTPAKPEPRLDPEPKPVVAMPPARNLNAKAGAQPSAPAMHPGKTGALPVPSGSILLQVAALSRRDDAMEIASSLEKKHFAAYVAPPQRDKLYRVQVGPFRDQKSADAARKGLESAGFKAFPVKH